MITEVKPNSLTIMLNVHAVDMTTNIDHMAEVGFPTVKSPPPIHTDLTLLFGSNLLRVAHMDIYFILWIRIQHFFVYFVV